MKLSNELIAQIERHIANGIVNVQDHPSAPLRIYNYTQRAQFDRVWDAASRMCRGLILDHDYNIVARPFPKFFNLEENIDTLPAGKFEVFEKYDGSLGILYLLDGVPYLATRGSFASDQSKRGTEMLQKWYAEHKPELRAGVTYLFEIIYPANRIVVDYGGRETLVYLAAIDNETGRDVDHPLPIETALHYADVTDFATLRAEEKDNAEGYVVRWEDGTRVKMKFAEYVRLHKLVNGVNERTIWELLSQGHGLDELLDHVPDEFYQWVRNTAEKLQSEFSRQEAAAVDAIMYHGLDRLSRKEAAAIILQKYPQVSQTIFSFLDKKPFAEGIWRRLKPSGAKSFAHDIDA